MNLVDQWHGDTLSPRRLLVLAHALPIDSAVVRAEVGEASAWGVSEHLLASLIEVVDATSWRSVMPHAPRRWKPPKPLQVPRPGQQHRTRRKATSADLVAIFGGAVRYQGGDA